MARLSNLDTFDDVLELPIQDRVWVIPSPPAKPALKISRMMAGLMNAEKGLPATPEQLRSFEFNDEEETELMKDLLGEDTFNEMQELYSWSLMQKVLMTVIVWVAFNEQAAEAFWTGKAPAPNRAQRRGKKKKK